MKGNRDDGFDIVSSSNVLVEDVFVRTNDDCVVIKNTGDVDVHDVTVRRGVLWNMPTGGNAVEVGFELRNKPVHDVRFEDIDFIHVERGAAISIHNGDTSDVHAIVFDNIRVEDVRRKLMDFAVIFAQYGPDRPQSQEERQARMDRGGGQVSRPHPRCHRKEPARRGRHAAVQRFSGFDDEHMVENVTIVGLRYQGRRLRNPSGALLSTSFARGVQFH